ncbi:hypothetical protein N2K95_06770 [Arthrobacter zhaoxinii]|uniref:Uncharacterized protein n=1 Tax=Arthrobacter zhaoxinii TaxID=2964616 RepID=A0ABY5YTA3_9MICC|nr:hypothetical protein [Arthrobacter zhaoxinii]UWX98347.1 hypothetical protein N2K95_06770 [Arthrobacter zhaoxinii]
MPPRPIISVDIFPDFSAMTDSTLESLCDQVFTQLEDGPIVEGLFAFYLSIQTEIEDRQSAAADTMTASDVQEQSAAPIPA